jgi:putative DNA primase/helicase
MLDARAVALALGGEVSGRGSVLAPGPGHSRADRSLAIKLDSGARDGFVVHSFAGDDPLACRDHVRAALGLGPHDRRRRPPPPDTRGVVSRDNDNSAFALRIWDRAKSPHRTIVESYLASRGLALPPGAVSNVIRFLPALKLDGRTVGGMVALFTDIRSNVPCAIQRTFLDRDGRKLDRRMLGRAKLAAIKIDPDDSVTDGLTIGEGLETCLAARQAGFHPIWALGSAGAIAAFPLLEGVGSLTIIVDDDSSGTGHRAADETIWRWTTAGREVVQVTPCRVGDDFNDVLKRHGEQDGDAENKKWASVDWQASKC